MNWWMEGKCLAKMATDNMQYKPVLGERALDWCIGESTLCHRPKHTCKDQYAPPLSHWLNLAAGRKHQLRIKASQNAIVQVAFATHLPNDVART